MTEETHLDACHYMGYHAVSVTKVTPNKRPRVLGFIIVWLDKSRDMLCWNAVFPKQRVGEAKQSEEQWFDSIKEATQFLLDRATALN